MKFPAALLLALVASCATTARSVNSVEGPVSLSGHYPSLGLGGPEEFRRELHSDPTLRSWVEESGMPDYFDGLTGLSGGLRLIYLERDLLVAMPSKHSSSNVMLSNGIPEELADKLPQAEQAELLRIRKAKVKEALTRAASDAGARSSLQEQAETSITEEPADAKAVWETNYRPPTRGEFETRADFEARLAHLDPEALLFFELPVIAQYDIDKEMMHVAVRLRECFGNLVGKSLMLRDDTTSEATIGSNAYGKESLYSETTGITYEAVIDNLDEFLKVARRDGRADWRLACKNDGSYSESELDLSFAVPPKQYGVVRSEGDRPTADIARDVKESLRVRVGLSLRGCFFSDEYWNVSTARTDFPYASNVHRKYMAARLRTVVVYDDTGRVWASFVGL
jgi:hypothetical protein